MKLCPSKQNLVTNIFRLRCFPPVTSEQAQTVGQEFTDQNFLGRIRTILHFAI